MIQHLTSLGIPLEQKINEAIASHDLSQAWAAIRHIEATGASIKSKYAVFLYQLPLQPIEGSRNKLSAEFLEWYQYARGEQVEDIEPEYLPRDSYGEPLVRLMGDKYNRLIEWHRVKGGEDFFVCTGEALRSVLERFPALKAKLRRD